LTQIPSPGGGDMARDSIETRSTLTCPGCGQRSREAMPQRRLPVFLAMPDLQNPAEAQAV